MDRPLIIAHRGDSVNGPENTLAAIRSARLSGADWVEVDVQLTSDDELICLHDATLDRTTDAARLYPERDPRTASAFTLAEIKRLDAGTWKSARFAGERIPTLREVIAECARSRPLGLLVEVKVGSEESDLIRIAAALVPLVQRSRSSTTGMPFGGIVIQSFNSDLLRLIHSMAADIPLFRLVPPLSQVIPALFPSVETALKSVWGYASGLAIPESAATPELLLHSTALKLPLFVWTVNEALSLMQLTASGIAGVITDVPAVAAAVYSG